MNIKNIKILFSAMTVFLSTSSPVFAGYQELFFENMTASEGSATVVFNNYSTTTLSVQVNSQSSCASQTGGNASTGFAYTHATIGSDQEVINNTGDPVSADASRTLPVEKDVNGNWFSMSTGVNMGTSIEARGLANCGGNDMVAGTMYAYGAVGWTDGVGNVNVTANIPGASFNITGPASLSGSGTSNAYTNRPAGTYTIVWNAVSGYTTPPSQTLTLTSGNTITFSGTYGVSAPTINVQFTP